MFGFHSGIETLYESLNELLKYQVITFLTFMLRCDRKVMDVYMKEEFKARFVSVTYKASFELLFHASFVTFMSWLFI